HEDGLIRVLPALPTTWNSGKAKGLKARGNIVVDIEWKDNLAKRVTMSSPIAQTVEVMVNDQIKTIKLKAGEAFEVL
ncbi:MAG: glycoside hydrolase family 95 protein, partial [Oceanospirillaceae bacterium]|nr:glycoside hydrolase family 95 protein [Oceanospirillaceae bacterium]